MYSALLTRVSESVEALKRHLATSETLRSAIHEGALACKAAPLCFDFPLLTSVHAPDRLEWRVIDHCAAVTRLYAIYEQFAHEMIREHLSLLQSHVAFQNLSDPIKNSYRRGIAEILIKKDGPRYGHIKLSNLVDQYDRALSGKDYVLEPAAMLMQEQNLRLPELTRLFNAVGIESVDGWLEGHRAVLGFFADSGRLAASAESEMAELIKYRNDAAHGSINVDDLPGLDFLYEFCDFIFVVCQALSERVQLVGLERMIGNDAARACGKVSECLKADSVIVSKVSGDFKVGDTLYFCGKDYCFARDVTSIQIEGVNFNDVSCVEPTEVGFALDGPSRKKARIITTN